MIRQKVKTSSREELLDITGLVKESLSSCGMKQGACIVYVPHTTAGVTINENADPDVSRDIIMALGKLIPNNMGFYHAEGNSDAHTKATITGSSVTIPVEDGKLVLGTWQGIYFCEFDGPRNRNVYFQFIPS